MRPIPIIGNPSESCLIFWFGRGSRYRWFFPYLSLERPQNQFFAVFGINNVEPGPIDWFLLKEREAIHLVEDHGRRVGKVCHLTNPKSTYLSAFRSIRRHGTDPVALIFGNCRDLLRKLLVKLALGQRLR